MKETSVGSIENVSAAEFAGMKQLVRQSSDKIVSVLSANTNLERRYTLGNIAEALVDTEGKEAAHSFAINATETLKLDSDDEFGLWVALFKKGDMIALPKARRAAGLASEQLTFLEEIGAVELGGLHSAERLVELVQAGDDQSTDRARRTTAHVYITERTALFGKLYCNGDSASLDLALTAAKDAKAYTQQTGDQHYYRSEQALSDMAVSAIYNGKINDALTLLDAMENNFTKASLCVSLFKQGRLESLQPALQYLSKADKYAAEFIERNLANAGYAPALESVNRRANTHFNIQATEDRLQDFIVLYKSGDKASAKKISKIVHSEKNPERYLDYLLMADLKNEALELAANLYKAHPSIENAIPLVDIKHDNGLWQQVFDYELLKRGDELTASLYVRDLDSRAKSLVGKTS